MRMDKDAIENFVGGAVASDGDKPPIALVVCFAREISGVTRSRGSDDVNRQAIFAQASEGRASQFSRTATTGGGVDDSQKGFFHFVRLQRQNSRRTIELCQVFRQSISFDFERSGTGEVLLKNDDPMNALVV